MKYCLSSRQKDNFLKVIDEIKVKYRDRDIIYDLSQKYPEATIILETPIALDEELDWKEIDNYNILLQGRLILCLARLNLIPECKQRKIRYYYGFATGTMYDLRALKELGVCYLKVTAPAFFKMSEVAALDIPVRIAANIAHDGFIPRENGICGSWIRPEDLDAYKSYVQTLEFEGVDLEQERALYQVYAIYKQWPGDLKDLIINLDSSCDNRFIIKDFGTHRLNCGQRCQENQTCQICYRLLRLAEKEKVDKIIKIAKERGDLE